MLTKSQAIQELARRAKHELKIREARNDLKAFILFMQKDYMMGWVHKEICEALDQFYQDCLDGKNPRLMINLAPRHGKSQIVSRMFPAYLFGRNPNLSIIATSYGASLAQDMSRDVQRILDSDEYKEVFPDTFLNSSNVRTNAKGGYQRTVEKFEIVGHKGAYISAGVGGAITGKGADVLIIDDVFKSRAEAESPTIRQSVIDWYKGTAYTRLSPKSGILIIMTRWHTNDLAGFLLNEEKNTEGADKWKVINYPAIAIHDEPHRKAGEALHPERYPIDRLLAIKAVIGSYDFDAQYQQQPYTIGGNLIKSALFKRYEVLPPLEYRILVADTALKTKEANDYSVIACVGRTKDGLIYFIDMVRGKWASPQLRERVRDMWHKHQQYNGSNLGTLRNLCVEDKASGTDVIQTLQAQDRIPIQALQPNADKLVRVMDVLPYIESGYVYLPQTASWTSDFLDECEKFQANMKHEHDDQVDVLSYAVTLLRINQQGIKFSAKNIRKPSPFISISNARPF